MCVGLPARVIEIDLDARTGLVDVDGVRRQVDLTLVVDDGLSVGSWVLLHVGFAMSIVDESEAARTLEFIKLFEGEGEFEGFKAADGS
jgi:hydrogenase expression/formation protein HypC